MEIPKRYQNIIELGKALHVYGIPSYKIQSYLTDIAKKKSIEGSFMDLPTWVNYVFYQGKETYSYIECIPPGNLNLGALSRISELTNDIIDDKTDTFDVKSKLAEIHKKTKRVNHFVLALSYALSSGAFSLMIGTNWISLLFAFLLGAFVYGLVYLSTKSGYIETTLEALLSFLVTLFSCLLYLIFPEFNVGLTVISSIIVFIPGLGITTALEEITSKSLVSGGAKLFDAIISLFKQFFGAVLGFTIMAPFVNFQELSHDSNLPYWLMYLAIPLFALSLLPIFQVRKKDMFLGAVTGVLVFFLTLAFAKFGLLLSTFIGAVAAVAISNMFSKLKKSPQLVFLTQGIIMLVPGSKSFMGLSNSFLHTSILNTSNVFEQVALILMGIIGGLLFAGTFKNPKT